MGNNRWNRPAAAIRGGAMPLVASMLCAAVVLAVVGFAAQAPSITAVRALPRAARLDYAPDPPGSSLTPLSPDFVARTLGLGFGGAAAGLGGGAGLTPSVPSGISVTTPTYRCVNGHQTEDPLSPPCVERFSGDNGGATAHGVTGNEIRILVTAGLIDLFPVSLRRPTLGHYYDLGAPPSADETANMPWMQRLRLLQAYFNSRYQTYGRRVHLWASSFDAGPGEAARAQARLDDITVRPFAVLIVPGLETIGPEYADELGRRGVATFTTSTDTVDDALLGARPGLSWTYRPAARDGADLYGSYLCRKVIGQHVVASGNPGENGRSRRLGLLEVADQPGFDAFVQLVRRRIASCGGTIVDTERYREPNGCATQVEDEAGGGNGTDDARAMAGFKAHGVTTVLWPACLGWRMARAAEAIGYLPEWVLWGAGELDKNLWSSVDAWPAGVWDGHAFVVTPGTFRPDVPSRLCYQAMAEQDSHTPADDVADTMCDYYEGLRQLFTNLQLAGPYLTPQAMDRGARHLQEAATSDPQTARCAYPVGDYSCVKDAEVEWWDSLGPGNPTPPVLGVRAFGCWRAMEAGRRYTAGDWPPGNIDAQRRSDDPCNLFGEHVAVTPL